MQIIDNPLQDIPLLSVLRSPIFAFTTGELAAVRLANRNSLLFDALKILSDRHLDNETEKVDKSAAKKPHCLLKNSLYGGIKLGIYPLNG